MQTSTLGGGAEGPFLVEVVEAVYLSGGRAVVAGRVVRGRVRVNDAAELVGMRPAKRVVVARIEKGRLSLDEAAAGAVVSLTLPGVERGEAVPGQVLAEPGSIEAHTKFKARVNLRGADEGGWRTPISSGHRAQFYLRGADVKGDLWLSEGKESARPGERDIEAEVELVAPVAVETGLTFAVREGGRPVGDGTVTAVVG